MEVYSYPMPTTATVLRDRFAGRRRWSDGMTERGAAAGERAGLGSGSRWTAGTCGGCPDAAKEREGAFWRGRFRPTLVRSGAHLSRCFFYIDIAEAAGT
jgi:hypothetical protein